MFHFILLYSDGLLGIKDRRRVFHTELSRFIFQNQDLLCCQIFHMITLCQMCETKRISSEVSLFKFTLQSSCLSCNISAFPCNSGLNLF